MQSRNRNRLLATSLCLPLLGLSVAGAAEIPVKAPPPVLSWSGLYLGGNIGYGWGQKSFIDNFSSPLGSTDATPNPSGIVGGLQAGYNFQITSHLIGIEGNFDWSGAKTSFSCFPSAAPQTCSAHPRWVAATTGRLGEIFGPTLFYVKGGAAWVHDSYSSLAFAGDPELTGTLFVAEDTRAGWTAGVGFEYMFLPNWSAKVEYDYYGFPAKSVRFEDDSGDSYTKIIKQNMQTATVGINYHFGVAAAPAPYVTKTSAPNNSDSGSNVLGSWGADVSKLGVSGWVGTLIGPSGDLEKSGPRVWLYGEAGEYKFLDSGTAFSGVFQSGDVLVGYGFESENYSINLLAGVNAINHTVTPFDAENPVQGTEVGFKVRGDAYWTPTAQTMTSGEYEYSTAFRTYWVLQKIGLDVTDGKEIYVGPQVTFLGDQEHNEWRVGAHVSNLKFGRVQVDVSAGYANDSSVGAGAYGYLEMTVNY